MSKNVLIVGATSGIGRRLAELFAESGSQVGIIGRREHLLNEIQQQYPSNIHIKKADVTDQSIANAITDIISRMNSADIIVISASMVELNDNIIPETELKTVETNVTGFTTVMNAAWEYFRNKGSGHIVAITSIAAARGSKSAPVYNASKAFQSFYTQGLRLKAKYENNNIHFTELIPGYINTAMGKGDRMFWISSVDKAAKLCKKAIDKKKRRAFIPKRWWWVYHIQKLLPNFIYDALINSSWKRKSKTN